MTTIEYSTIKMKIFISLLVFITFCNPKKEPKKKEIVKKSESVKIIDTVLNKKILKAVDSILIKHKFNGQILIAKDDNVIIDSSIGYINFKDSSKIKRSTPFHLASVSKTFTGMLCMKLYEENKLDFNDLVIKYLPLFPYKSVTVSELLSHTSVLPDYANFITIEKRDFLKKKNNIDLNKLSKTELSYYTNEDILEYIIKYSPDPISNPKKEFQYCNTNYAILAIIIERITNMDYPSVLKKYIFNKYGLRNTFVFTKNNIDTYIPSYKENNEVWGLEKFDLIYGDKNIYSTTVDLLLWDNLLKSEGFLKKKTIELAYEPKSLINKENKTYGYGWRLIFPKNEEKIIYHNGWWHGNNTALIRLINENAVIIILGNRYNDFIYSHKRFVDILRNIN